jgi:hypothetical protein
MYGVVDTPIEPYVIFVTWSQNTRTVDLKNASIKVATYGAVRVKRMVRAQY